MQTKMVIVIRKDLNMRKGKIGGQCCHALRICLSNKFLKGFPFSPIEKEWLTDGLSTTIVCTAKDEKEFMEIYEKAKAVNLDVNMVTDAGKTEFHGVPTQTCFSIGPDEADKIDPITKHLPLA